MELRRAHLHFPGHWAHTWLIPLSLRRIASATPDLRLPSQPVYGRYQFILLGEQRHIVCEQLAQSRYVMRSDRDSNLRPFGCKSRHPNHYATMHATHLRKGVLNSKKYILGVDRARVCGYFVIHEMGLIQIYPCTEFEMPGNSFVPKMQRQPNAISRWANGCAQTNAWIFVVFYPTSTKSGSGIDFRYLISNIM